MKILERARTTSARRRLRTALALPAALALLAPTLGQLADEALAGWAPNHGHLVAGVGAHPHPHDRAAERDASTADPVFTFSEDGSIAASVAMAAPDDAARRIGDGFTRALDAPDTNAAALASIEVPTPPPQGLGATF